jgi:hypothetical protein
MQHNKVTVLLPTTSQYFDAITYNHIIFLIHVSAFIGHLQGET